MIDAERDGFERLYTPKRVGEILGLKTCTIRLWIALRKIGSVKIGDRAIRVPESEIAKLIEAGYVPARPIT